jgi:hypothetical protein
VLLPDNIHPEMSIYYNGALVLNILKESQKLELLELYDNVKKKYNISFPMLVLSLDWLYLIDIVNSNDKGEISLCI